LERKQEGRRKVKREEGNNGRCSEAEIETSNATTLSMAEKANAFSAGDNRACSNGRSKMDECSSGEGSRAKSGDPS